jgi:hypothetical protein
MQIELRQNTFPLFWHDVSHHPFSIVCIGALLDRLYTLVDWQFAAHAIAANAYPPRTGSVGR